MDHATSVSDRLHLLVDAGIALSSELSLDALLQRIVETGASERVGRDAIESSTDGGTTIAVEVPVR